MACGIRIIKWETHHVSIDFGSNLIFCLITVTPDDMLLLILKKDCPLKILLYKFGVLNKNNAQGTINNAHNKRQIRF